MDWLGVSPTWGQLIIVYAFLILVNVVIALARAAAGK
jgi:hypothetical protein